MPWMQISVSPEATWISAVSLIPPIAIFLGCVLLSYRERRLMSLVVLSVGMVSVFLGLLQVSQGPSSALRFFVGTNASEAVGFFANRNHQAALVYTLTVLAAAWTVNATFTAPARRDQFDAATVMMLVACFTTLVVLISAQIMTRSRAGVGLTIVAVIGAYALAYPDWRRAKSHGGRRSSGASSAKMVLGMTTVAILFAVQFGLYRFMDRFAADPLADARIPFGHNTIAAAKAYMPFGSGMGTFVPVYAMFEPPQDTLADSYANRAHDDVLELWLETGVGGIVLMTLFVIWLVLRCIKVWRRAPPGGREIDYFLARAATLIIGLLIAHSFVDYPLRTGAMMAIMAFACALLVTPVAGAESEAMAASEDTRDKMRQRGTQQTAATAPARTRSRPLPVPSGVAANPATAAAGERGLAGIAWPEEWRKPANKVK
jgi:O-antigen ligase